MTDRDETVPDPAAPDPAATLKGPEPNGSPTVPEDPAKRGPINRFVFVFLMIITTLFMTVSITAVWTNRTLTDTDNFVAAMAPLAEDPAIQETIANRTTERIIRALEPEEQFREALPDQLDLLAGPLAGGVETLVRRQAQSVVESDAFANLWEETIRASHTAVLAMIEGREGTVSVDRGVVSLNLAPITDRVGERLTDTPLGRLDLSPIAERVPDEIVLAESNALASAAWAVDMLKGMAWWSVIVSLAAAVATVLAHRDRRRGVMWVGVALMIAGLLPLLGINVGRAVVIEPILGPLAINPDAPIAAYDVVISGFVAASRGLAVLGGLLALGMYLLGSSSRALSVRGGVARKVATTGGDYGDVGRWVIDHKSTLRVVGIAAAVVILVVAQLTVVTIMLLALFLAAYLFALELPKQPSDTA
jgi:hypothetical protein